MPDVYAEDLLSDFEGQEFDYAAAERRMRETMGVEPNYGLADADWQALLDQHYAAKDAGRYPERAAVLKAFR